MFNVEECMLNLFSIHLILIWFDYLFMKDKLSFSDRTSFSRFSHRFKTACISEGTDGVKFLSLASAILHNKGFKIESLNTHPIQKYTNR